MDKKRIKDMKNRMYELGWWYIWYSSPWTWWWRIQVKSTNGDVHLGVWPLIKIMNWLCRRNSSLKANWTWRQDPMRFRRLKEASKKPKNWTFKSRLWNPTCHTSLLPQTGQKHLWEPWQQRNWAANWRLVKKNRQWALVRKQWKMLEWILRK